MIAIISNPVNSTVAIAAEALKKHGVYDKRRCVCVCVCVWQRTRDTFLVPALLASFVLC